MHHNLIRLFESLKEKSIKEKYFYINSVKMFLKEKLVF